MNTSILFFALLAWSQTALAADSTPDSGVEVASEARGIRFVCRRLAGLTAGFTTTDRSWVFIDDGPVRFVGSPTVGLSCDTGSPTARWFLGLDSSPFVVTRHINSSELGRDWLTVSTGALLGAGDFQGGPIATVGWGRLGLGVRGIYLPWGAEKRRRGIEARLTGIYNGGFGSQISVLYTLTSDTLEARR